MEIKTVRSILNGISNATVVMESGDHLSIGYKDPHTGQFNVFNVSAQHLVFLVTHEQTEATMMLRPSVGVQFVPGVK